MKNDANQPPDTATNKEHSTRTRPNRRIDATTIAEIARLCARQLTESEACRRIGIRPRQWFNWKDKHNRSEKFAALLEEFRAGRIDDLIARIEKSADGVGMKQPDWRAAAFLLSVADARRFSTSGGQSVEVNVTSAVSLTDMHKAMAIALARHSQRQLDAQAIDCPPVPNQLGDKKDAP